MTMTVLGIMLLVAAAGVFAASVAMGRTTDPARRRTANAARAIAAAAVLASIVMLLLPFVLR